MGWNKLDTHDIDAVKYDPARKLLKARLKSGYMETYHQVSESRYRELVTSANPHDADIFLSNIIRPNRVSQRVTLTARARRIARYSVMFLLAAAVLVLLGLWNSGFLDTYLDTLLQTKP